MVASFKSRRSSSASRLPHYTKELKTPSSRSLGLSRRWSFQCITLAILLLFLIRHLLTSSPPVKEVSFTELELAQSAQLKPPGTRIPKIVHFIYGLRGPDPTLDLIHYLAIKSAHDTIKPDKIFFHYHYRPVGHNFERALPMITLSQIDLVTNVFGRPVSHYAHQSDVVRLQVLAEHGGIYLDLDLISLQPIDHLLDHNFVMGQEGQGGSVGLCNAMIMSRPNSYFLQRWYATYSSFDEKDWNYHSVVLPGKLAPYFPSEITILNHTSYFWPLWDGPGLRTLYLEKSYDFSQNLGTHVWESAANHHLMKNIDDQVVMNIDNSLYCKLRPFLLDGKPDPRPDACRIIQHSEREDRLVGYWPLGLYDQTINPMPATDISGHSLNGLVRNPDYSQVNGVHLTGKDSYVFLPMPVAMSIDQVTVSWWMKTKTTKEGGAAMVIQTEHGKVYLKTEKVNVGKPDGLSLGVSTVIRDEDWVWSLFGEIKASPYSINLDGAYHHYGLVIDRQGLLAGGPRIVLYMDGYVIASKHDWDFPVMTAGSIIHGIWFGSAESEVSNYQDAWDNRTSLDCYIEHVRVWETSLGLDQLQDQIKNDSMVRKETVEQFKNKEDLNLNLNLNLNTSWV
ncbi:hypothetical protein CLU79DRAFT_696178 [Phycomyces nitens]|nr:hypothetical protein CLU79DRAFT_696178 [Phycomyces nitens]